MVRGKAKVPMEFIKNEKLRNAIFHKRKAGLKKKLREFKILCDVDACMIVYGGPSDNCKESRFGLDTFPEKPDEVNGILARYIAKGQGSGALTSSKETNLADFYENRARKINEDISRTRRAAYRAKYPGWDARLGNASADQLKDVLCLLDKKIAYVNLLSRIGKESTSTQGRPFGSMMGIDDFGGAASQMMIGYNGMLSTLPQSCTVDDIAYPKLEGNYENYQHQLDFNGIDQFCFDDEGFDDQTYMLPPLSSFDPSPSYFGSMIHGECFGQTNYIPQPPSSFDPSSSHFESMIHDECFGQTNYIPPPQRSFDDPSPSSYEPVMIHDGNNFDEMTTNSFCINGYDDQEESEFITANASYTGMLLPAVLSSQLGEAEFNEWGYIIHDIGPLFQ